MSEKELIAKMDAALAHVDPDRRKFLGILLAGVAAAPLLTSADLAAQDKPSGQKTEVFPKNATSAKGNTALKNNNTIKNDAVIKNNSSTIKLTNAGAIKDGSSLKNNSGANAQKTPQIKASTGTGQSIKSSSGTTKLDANANSSTIK
jgi:hypothetical protein